MTAESFVKYGGMKFVNNVPPAEINRFVRALPAGKRDSLFEVVRELDRAGLITLDDSELTTIDVDTVEWQE